MGKVRRPHIDFIELKSIISSLVNNAVEAYLDKKGAILVLLKLDPDCFSIDVADNGSGMRSKVLKSTWKHSSYREQKKW